MSGNSSEAEIDEMLTKAGNDLTSALTAIAAKGSGQVAVDLKVVATEMAKQVADESLAESEDSPALTEASKRLDKACEAAGVATSFS
ncbi:MAG: hypothetical protein JXA67_20595 [Micromonosporaceae bacterium]|nr:hypothetical protein [Micromonosporaceae bacterium]